MEIEGIAAVRGCLWADLWPVEARELIESALKDFVREIRDRLSALGVAQTLFVAREHAPCDVRVLVPALLQPFSVQGCPIEISELPDVSVDQGQADALALVFGEFAVNSSKHGALSAQGFIRVRAELEGEHLTILWTERSSKAVAAHERDGGQGLRLITRILAARNGSIALDWQENGLDAQIRLERRPDR
jgi:two-component sensor histidine kinase